MKSYISHLECSKTGDIYSSNEVHNLSKDGMPLLARYDLAKLKAEQDILFQILFISKYS